MYEYEIKYGETTKTVTFYKKGVPLSMDFTKPNSASDDSLLDFAYGVLEKSYKGIRTNSKPRNSQEDKDSVKKLNSEKISSENNTKPTEIETKTIEEQPTNPSNKTLKENIKEESETNKKEVEENKPKMVIKIPKPFAMGYFIIDLSALLGGLLGMLSGFAMGLLMSKLGDLLKDSLSFDMNNNNKINASKINTALNSINLEDVINETLNEENIMKLNRTLKESNITKDLEQSKTSSDEFFDTISNFDDTGNYINDNVPLTDDSSEQTEQYDKPQKNKPTKKRDIYTINKRGRKDLLNSTEAEERLNYKSTNKKTSYNKNYGMYW